jgi:hypothetical protein
MCAIAAPDFERVGGREGQATRGPLLRYDPTALAVSNPRFNDREAKTGKHNGADAPKK